MTRPSEILAFIGGGNMASALIGGLRIRVGSDVYDGSVRAGLAALEKHF